MSVAASFAVRRHMAVVPQAQWESIDTVMVEINAFGAGQHRPGVA